MSAIHNTVGASAAIRRFTKSGAGRCRLAFHPKPRSSRVTPTAGRARRGMTIPREYGGRGRLGTTTQKERYLHGTATGRVHIYAATSATCG